MNPLKPQEILKGNSLHLKSNGIFNLQLTIVILNTFFKENLMRYPYSPFFKLIINNCGFIPQQN